MTPETLTLAVSAHSQVSGLWLAPPNPTAVCVLAHGAGAGMTHRAMAATAVGLAERGIATLRYNFAYMEAGSKRPDAPAMAQAVVRAAVLEGQRRAAGLPLFAGGRSFGGRMTSGAQAQQPLPGVSGLVFFAFPLHPAGKVGIERAVHLSDVHIPMLFLQGDNDALASCDHLRGVVERLGARATLRLYEAADHSFHVPARSGRTDAELLALVLDDAARWMREQTPA